MRPIRFLVISANIVVISRAISADRTRVSSSVSRFAQGYSSVFALTNGWNLGSRRQAPTRVNVAEPRASHPRLLQAFSAASDTMRRGNGAVMAGALDGHQRLTRGGNGAHRTRTVTGGSPVHAGRYSLSRPGKRRLSGRFLRHGVCSPPSPHSPGVVSEQEQPSPERSPQPLSSSGREEGGRRCARH